MLKAQPSLAQDLTENAPLLPKWQSREACSGMGAKRSPAVRLVCFGPSFSFGNELLTMSAPM